MDRFSDRAPLSDQAGAVLSTIAAEPDPLGLRLNDVAAITGLDMAHVGRQLRTLENDRLVGFGAGRWRVTLRGRRVVAQLPSDAQAPASAPVEAG